MNVRVDPNKAKIVRRVLQILDYFDERKGPARAHEIVRHYEWPQSSTSELLDTLVSIGLLYKDSSSRTYAPTPLAAMIGWGGQPDLVRNGSLYALVERLRMQTGLAVAVIGKVGTRAQVFLSVCAPFETSAGRGNGLVAGARSSLADNAPGWLLLSTIEPRLRDPLLWRVRAETPNLKVDAATLRQQIEQAGRTGHLIGPAGFGSGAVACCLSLLGEAGNRPLVLALIDDGADSVRDPALIELVQCTADACLGASPF